MRKADYSALAMYLKLQKMDKLRKEKHPFHDGQLKQIETVARWCADNLNVNKEPFLKACGIE